MIRVLSIVSAVLMIISYILSDRLGTNEVIDAAYGFCSGSNFGCIVLVIIVTTGLISKIYRFKKRIMKLDNHR